MTLIKFWIISVRNRSLMYGREFPVNRARAKKMALPNQQLPITNSEKDEQFLAGVCDALGIELPRRSGSMELVEDDTGLESTSMPVFDFSTSNQLPAVSVRFNVNCVVWPVLIIESGGLYFCGLPLISNNSNRLIDHLSISAAFTTLQTLIGWYARDNNLRNIEVFVAKYMPFGQLIESPNANDLSLLSIDGSSASTGGRVSSQLHNEDPLLRIRVDECISSGSGDQEVIYGTVRVQNNRILGSKAKLYLKLDECDLLNLMCSPNCRRSSRRQDLNCPTSTNDGRLQSSPNSNSDIPGSLNDIPIDQLQFDLHTDSPKYFHYLCDNRLFKPLLSYEFVVTRLDTTRRPGTSDRPGRTYSLRLRLELNVKPQSLKFVDFRVVFPEIRPESDRKLLNSHMNHGQLTVDRRGLSWQLDNRFPRTLQPELTMDVGCPDKDETQFAEAQLQFKTESLNYGLPRITSDRIRIENATRKPKMNIEFCLTTVNYKLIANFQ